MRNGEHSAKDQAVCTTLHVPHEQKLLRGTQSKPHAKRKTGHRMEDAGNSLAFRSRAEQSNQVQQARINDLDTVRVSQRSRAAVGDEQRATA